MGKSIAQLSRGFTIDRTLMRSWKRFVEWRENGREVRRIVDAIEDAKRKWIAQGKKRRDLLEGRLLKDGRRLLKEAQAEVFRVKGFIRKSLWWRRSELASLLVIPLLIFGIPAEYVWREEVIQQDYNRIKNLEGDQGEESAVLNIIGGCWAKEQHSWIRKYARERLFGNCRPLSNVNLIKFSFSNKIRLEGIDFSHANLSRSSLKGSHVKNVNFSGANLSKSNLDMSTLENVRFGGANLDAATFFATQIDERTTFDGARLSNISEMSRTSLFHRSFFRLVDFSGTHFSHKDLRGTLLSAVNLSGADLSDANLEDVKFECYSYGSYRTYKSVHNCPNLKDIKWNKNTNWKNIQGWETVENIPPALKQQLGLK